MENTGSDMPSIKPYLIRAWHDWCSENGYTPYIVVAVNADVAVPQEYVKDGHIVLNSSWDATGSLRLGNDAIEFQARFSGRVYDMFIPIERVQAIYARENGAGMEFEVQDVVPAAVPDSSVAKDQHKGAADTPARSGMALQIAASDKSKTPSSGRAAFSVVDRANAPTSAKTATSSTPADGTSSRTGGNGASFRVVK